MVHERIFKQCIQINKIGVFVCNIIKPLFAQLVLYKFYVIHCKIFAYLMVSSIDQTKDVLDVHYFFVSKYVFKSIWFL